MSDDPVGLEAWLSAVESSHRRLSGAVGGLTADQITGPSYDRDWSIAQVLSHLGSGAEIFTAFLQAGLRGEPAPGVDQFTPVWERWNAKAPEAQAADALVADRAFLDQLAGLDDAARRSWTLPLFGTDQTLVDVVKLRLGEHAVHTWDVVVVGDAAAVVAPDAVDLLIDNLGAMVARVGAAPEPALEVAVTTHGPDRRYALVAGGGGVELTGPGPDEAGRPTLDLPAEAFLRLVYGRLDPEHTPDSVTGSAPLDLVRRVFPGF